MVKLILVCIILIASAGSAYWVKLNSGDLSFTFLDYEVQTSVAEFFVWSLIFIFVLQFVSLSLYKVLQLPQKLKDFLSEKSKDKLIIELSSSINDIAALDYEQIKKRLGRLQANIDIKTYASLKYFSKCNSSNTELINQLTILTKDEKLKKMALTRLFEISEDEGDYFVAANYCTELLKIEKTPELVNRYIKCFFKAKRWRELESILNSEGIVESLFIKNISHYLGSKNTKVIKAICRYKIALEQCDIRDKELCKKYLKQAQAELVGFVPLAKHLIDHLAKDDPSLCLRAIKRQWREEPHYSISEALIANFDTVLDAKFQNILKDVAKQNPTHYESLLLLSRAYLDSDQFEEAAQCLSESLGGVKKRRACTLMAEYCLRTHANKTEVINWLRESLVAKEDREERHYFWNLITSSWQNCQDSDSLFVE